MISCNPVIAKLLAGYVVYGSSTMLVYTTGCGVHAFTYDPSLRVFCLSHEVFIFRLPEICIQSIEGNLH